MPVTISDAAYTRISEALKRANEALEKSVPVSDDAIAKLRHIDASEYIQIAMHDLEIGK